MGFLKNILGKKSKGADTSEVPGPLRLVPGDTVIHYKTEYLVVGVTMFREGDKRHYQYHLSSADEGEKVLALRGLGELTLSLEQPIEIPIPQEDADGGLVFEGEPMRRVRQGIAQPVWIGTVPLESSYGVDYREYEDEDGESLFVLERWGRNAFMRTGEYIHEGEITLKREGEERFEIKAPKKLDRKAIIEARRAGGDGPTA